MDGMADSPSVFQLIARDIESFAEAAAAFQGHKAGLLRQVSTLITPSLACCVLIRLAHAAHLRGWNGLARALARINALVHHAEIDPAASIGPGLYIPHPPGIVIRARAGCRLTLYASAIVGPLLPLPLAGDTLASCPVLGDDVTVGANAVVAGSISIGSRTRIGPGAVVLASTPAGSVLIAIGSMGRIARR
jgi:serine O-acetyltransferase